MTSHNWESAYDSRMGTATRKIGAWAPHVPRKPATYFDALAPLHATNTRTSRAAGVVGGPGMGSSEPPAFNTSFDPARGRPVGAYVGASGTEWCSKTACAEWAVATARGNGGGGAFWGARGVGARHGAHDRMGHDARWRRRSRGLIGRRSRGVVRRRRGVGGHGHDGGGSNGDGRPGWCVGVHGPRDVRGDGAHDRDARCWGHHQQRQAPRKPACGRSGGQPPVGQARSWAPLPELLKRPSQFI
ncbi:hypothetical protein FOA52_013853 [Chlamydomonas sp. UWO 241]|nr:hypothetical protein FOA52_013853 [Chlamydomonas sp. UWO 241]